MEYILSRISDAQHQTMIILIVTIFYIVAAILKPLQNSVFSIRHLFRIRHKQSRHNINIIGENLSNNNIIRKTKAILEYSVR